MITQFQADPAEAGTRLDVFLAGAMAEMTRSHVQKLIEEGRVTVNGAAAKGNRKLKTGDSIVCDVPDPKPAEITAEEIGLLSGRFPYELLCDIGKRVPRVYLKDGKVAGTKDYFKDIYTDFAR